MLDVRRLRALRELAERGTIAAAADALHLTPSAVSQQLAALEREVGQPLLEPDGRGVRLTPGRARPARPRRRALRPARAPATPTSTPTRRGEAGLVRVGAFPTAIAGSSRPPSRGCASARPGVRARGDRGGGARGVRRASARASSTSSSRWRPTTRRRPTTRASTARDLQRDVLDAALPADHPLAGERERRARRPARPSRGSLPPPGWTCEQVVLSALPGGRLHAARRAPHVATGPPCSRSSQAGLGVALVPRLAQAATRRPASSSARWAASRPRRHIFAACRRGAEHGPAVAAVLDALGLAAYPGGMEKVMKSEQEWRERALARAVPRAPRGGHRAAVHRRVRRREGRRHLHVRRLRPRAVRRRHEVRQPVAAGRASPTRRTARTSR